MDMHEATDEAFDTFSLSDLHIYSDPTCSSHEEQDHIGNSFSSFRFKIAGSLPAEEVVLLGSYISLPENTLKQHHKSQKPSRMKTFPVQDDGGRRGHSGSQDGDGLGRKVANLAPVVRPRRRSGRGFLMFGSGGPPSRMEIFDLRSMQAPAASPTRIVPMTVGSVGGVNMRRKSGNRLGKFFGACIPIV